MLVMMLENVPTSLKGELSRWLIEPKAGVFLGNPTARIRERLWQNALKKRKGGYVLQIWSDSSPQGYSFRSEGESSRQLEDFEGIALVACVGAGLFKMHGTIARLFSAVSEQGIQVRTMFQAPSELSIILGVNESDLEKAIVAIYDAFIR